MRKQVFGRRFKRDRNERKALFSGLISSMVLKGRINTTEEKIKAVRADLEKLVTKAKRGEASKRLLQPYLKPFEIDRMIYEIGPTFANRPGGYTRIIKTGRRLSDNAGMAILEWTEEIRVQKPEVRTQNGKEAKTAKSPASKSSKRASSKGAKIIRKSSGSRRAKENPSSRKATKGKASK